MREFLTKNKLLIAAIMLMMIAAGVLIGERWSVEAHDKTYDVVLDYDELAAMVEQSDYDMNWWLEYFKDMGISKVGLTEESLITLMENTNLSVTGTMMADLIQKAGWDEEYPKGFIEKINHKGYDKFDVLVEADGAVAANFVTGGIQERFASDRYVAYTEGEGENVKAYFLIDGSSNMALYSELYKYKNSKAGGFIERTDVVSSKIMYISLGLNPEKVKTLQAAGMEIVPRTLAYSGWNDNNYANAVVSGYKKYDIRPSYIIAGGEAVIGYDDGIDFAKEYICNNHISIGLIENTTQLQNIMQYGVEDVARASDYNTVRVFTVWNYIQYRYQYYGYAGAEEIENTLFRAVTERNIRVIYFKPFKYLKDEHTYVTNPEEYQQMFSNLAARLDKHGFTMGQASVQKTITAQKLFQILVGFGAVMGAVLLLISVVPINRKWSNILSGLGKIGVILAYLSLPNTSVLITSFASAVVFACLAVTYVTAQSRYIAEEEGISLVKIIGFAAMTLAVGVCISLMGGVMTAAPISQTNYMLEISVFRGVKLSQLLPIAYFAVAYLAYYGFGSRKRHIGQLELHDIKDLCELKISVWMCVAAGLLGLVGYYYISRTGHDSSIQVSSMEMLFRNFLEDNLIARPRTKEFLFAFPAIMMMVYCSQRHLKLLTILFGLCGVIGLTSVVNTFMHIRTPLYLGFARTGYSLLFGIVLGALAIIIFDYIYKTYIKFFKEKVDKALNV